ncbi:glycosyltransferase [Sporomusa sphaeroides]|uniref:methyltransferase domain-containing protein n=1 Tax=Sporomusa sphaeroides TaxID=47679 RepID=UPI003DA08B95
MDYIERIEQLVISKEYDQALDLIDQLEDEQKRHPCISNIVGVICTYGKMYEKADSFFLQALKGQPDNVEFLYNAAYSAFRQQNYAQALGWIEKCEQQENATFLEEIQELKNQISTGFHERGVRNVLMIAYYFPPLSGSGVFRSLKLAKYLPENQWQPTIISADKPQIGWNFADGSLLQEVPETIRVHRLPDLLSGHQQEVNLNVDDANKLLEFLSIVFWGDQIAVPLIHQLSKQNETLSNLLTFPDSTLWWAYQAVQHIEQNMDLQEFDVLYTTSGPCAAHLVGYYLKKKYNIPWVADFRDEWINNPYSDFDLENNPFHKLLYCLEKRIMTNASHTITISDYAKQNYINTYGIKQHQVTSITNGYDEEDFVQIMQKTEPNDRFTIVYGGLIYTKHRDISPLLHALHELVEERKIDETKFFFRIIGVEPGDSDLAEKALIYGLEKNIEALGYRAHRETLQFCTDADLLFCMIGSENKFQGCYTGKIFDYLRCGQPILAFAPYQGAVDLMLSQTGHGICVLETENEKIKEVILEQYRHWQESKTRSYLSNDNIFLYERRFLAKAFTDIFTHCLNQKTEISADTYDSIYLKGGSGQTYHKHYTESVYYNSWKQAMSYLTFLSRDISIVDVGCGVGQFANMLFEQGFTNYHGIDFAENAIAIAKQANPKFQDKFMVDDAFKSSIFELDYDLVILFEILEHLNEDLILLERIKPGKKVLFSVPNFPDENHVRYFTSIERVINRYRKSIKILDTKTVNLNNSLCLYYVAGIKL